MAAAGLSDHGATIRRMSEHVIHSPRHGALPVIVDEHRDGYGRGWRARLWPAPPKLAHLVAVYGVSEQDALDRTVHAVELYDAHAMQVRHRALCP